MFSPPILLYCFGGLYVWVVSRLSLQANVTPIPKGQTSYYVDNYRLISITSVLFKVLERLVSIRFAPFMERSGVLLKTQFAYLKGMGTCYALL